MVFPKWWRKNKKGVKKMDIVQNKYRFFNEQNKQNEEAFASSEQELQQLYNMVGEPISGIELIQSAPVVETVSVDNVHTVDAGDIAGAMCTGTDSVYTGTGDVCTTIEPPKYFNLGSKRLKLENGVLYQKEWIEVDDPTEYRLISTNTGKCINMESKLIQKLDWVEVDDNESGVE